MAPWSISLLTAALGSGWVVVPQSALPQPRERAPAPPVSWLSQRLVIEARPGPQTQLRLRWDLEALAPGWVDLPLVGAGLALSSATLDGAPLALSPASDGLLHATVWLRDRHSLELTGALETPASELALPLLPASRAIARLQAPGLQVEPRDAIASRPDGHSFDLSAREALRFAWRPEGPPRPRPPVLTAESAVAIRVDGVEAEGSARLRFLVRQGSVSSVRIALSSAATGLSVTGQGVSAFRQEGDSLVVTLDGPVDDAVNLDLGWRARLVPGGDAPLPLPVPEAASPTGWVSLLRADGALLVPEADAGLEATSSRAIPDWAQGLAEGETVATWKTGGRAPALRCRLLSFDPIEAPPTLVDQARYEIAYAAQGRMLVRARYQVRNDRRQYLRVTPPPGFTVIGATVAGRLVQPLTSEGALLVPLEKSVESLDGLISFPVELSFWGLEPAWSAAEGRHGRSLVTPALDAPVAYARWEVVLPPEVDGLSSAGLPTAVSDWSTGAASLSYGRAYGDEAVEEAVVTTETTTLRARRGPARAEAAPANTAPDPEAAIREELGQTWWNEAYNAYKENRFEDASVALDNAMSYDPNNSASQALKKNVEVLLGDTELSAEDEVAARRVKDLARARTADDAVAQEALKREAEANLRAGNLEEAEASYQQLLKVTSKLAQVEQAESVDQKQMLDYVASSLSDVRKKKDRSSGSSGSTSPGLGGRGSGLGGGAEGLGGLHANPDAGHGAVARRPTAGEQDRPDQDYDGIPDEIDSYDFEDLDFESPALLSGEIGVFSMDPAPLDDLLWELNDPVWYDLRDGLVDEAPGEGFGAMGYGSGGGGASGYGVGSGSIGRGAPIVMAAPATVQIPRAGTVLRFEQRLVPEGVPLTLSLRYRMRRR